MNRQNDSEGVGLAKNMGLVCSTYLHVLIHFRLSLPETGSARRSYFCKICGHWLKSMGKLEFFKVLHITFLWRSCKSVEKTKVLGCEDQPTEARGDNSQAVQCTCDTDRCNSWEPESIQPVNPRTSPYGPPTQSEIVSPTPSSNSMPSISNTNGIPTQIKFDMGLKTRHTVTTAAIKMINGSHESKAKLWNTGAARQGSNGNALLPHYFLVYFSTISIIQFCILQWLVLWESFCLCLDWCLWPLVNPI